MKLVNPSDTLLRLMTIRDSVYSYYCSALYLHFSIYCSSFSFRYLFIFTLVWW